MLVLAKKNASCLNVPDPRNNLQKRIKNGVNRKSNTVWAKSIGLAECRKGLNSLRKNVLLGAPPQKQGLRARLRQSGSGGVFVGFPRVSPGATIWPPLTGLGKSKKSAVFPQAVKPNVIYFTFSVYS